MYEKYYGLTEKPFSLLPDPGFLFMSRKHSMAFAMLQYGLSQQAGFTVIAGEVGSGKTTLIRHLLNQVSDDVTVGLITNTHSSFGDLLRWVMLAFSLDYQGRDNVDLFARFQEFMIAEYGAGRRTVLIIDEAQNMSTETLEELRMLSNINSDKHQLLQLVLVGQPELRRKLRRPELRQFAQRVSVAYYLELLTAEETADYVRHRLARAGGDPELFEADALRALHHHAGGVPRVINSLADMALVYGFAEDRPGIGIDIIEEVARDKVRTGLFEDPDEPSAGDTAGDAPPLHRVR